jgi:hypothetical protein
MKINLAQGLYSSRNLWLYFKEEIDPFQTLCWLFIQLLMNKLWSTCPCQMMTLHFMTLMVLALIIKDIILSIRTRETSLTFEELHDILTAHETYLKRIEATQSQLLATANNTQHSASHYHQRQLRNYQYRNMQRPWQ